MSSTIKSIGKVAAPIAGSVIGGYFGGPAGAAIGGSLGGSLAGSSASGSAYDDSYGDSLALADLQNQWNRANSEWTIEQNQDITDRNLQRNIDGLQFNRPNQNSDFGNINWTQGEDGTWQQNTSIAPELQGSLDMLRGKYGDMIGGLESGFGVDNSVMQAIRGLQETGLSNNENAQRARYAAMGVPMSSSAYSTGEQNLARTRTDADLQAILGGNNAWLDNQNNIRSNLGTMGSLETTWNNNANAMPGFNEMGIPLENQIGGVANANLGNVIPDANAAGQSAGSSWQNFGDGIGELGGALWEKYGS